RTDLASSIGLLLVNSLPEFVIGLCLLSVLAVGLGWLAGAASGALFASGWTAARAFTLPLLTLVSVGTPYLAGLAPVAGLETRGHAHVRSALLRGVPVRRLTWQHVVPNASLPVVNVVALNLAELLGGLVVVEVVFAFPGVGQLLVDSVNGKDIPTVQAIALI